MQRPSSTNTQQGFLLLLANHRRCQSLASFLCRQAQEPNSNEISKIFAHDLFIYIATGGQIFSCEYAVGFESSSSVDILWVLMLSLWKNLREEENLQSVWLLTLLGSIFLQLGLPDRIINLGDIITICLQSGKVLAECQSWMARYLRYAKRSLGRA